MLLTLLLCSCGDIEDGIKAYEEEDFESALEIFNDLVDNGDAQASYYIAEMYYRGDGVQKDKKLAYMHYRLAAEKGHAEAQHNLSMMLEFGEGVAVNNRESFLYGQNGPQTRDCRVRRRV